MKTHALVGSLTKIQLGLQILSLPLLAGQLSLLHPGMKVSVGGGRGRRICAKSCQAQLSVGTENRGIVADGL